MNPFDAFGLVKRIFFAAFAFFGVKWLVLCGLVLAAFLDGGCTAVHMIRNPGSFN